MVDFFDKEAKKDIIDAIVRAESMTSGEIRVHVQKKCKDDVMHAAKKVFHRLRMQRTKHRNAVLIFIALESRRFAILGDSGIHRQTGDFFWNETRDKIASYFSKGQLKEGIVAGILGIGEKLKTHFPAEANDKNEISNEITGG